MELTETQEQILEATMSCIVRDGLDGTSLRDVATEADVSLGLLSYHFDDRRSLILAAFQLATDRLLDASVGAIEGTSASAASVEQFIRGAFRDEFLDRDYLAMRLALWAIARTDPEVERVEASLYKRYLDQLSALLRKADPAVLPDEAIDRATDVVVTQNGLWLNWARYGDADALARGLQRCVALALHP